MTPVDGQPSKENNRHRTLGLAFAYPSYGCLWVERGSSKRVIADYSVSLARGYEHAGRSCSLGLPRIPVQPIVEGGLAAFEFFEPVPLVERLWLRIRHGLLEDAGGAKELRETWVVPYRPVEQLHECAPLLFAKLEASSVGEDVLSFIQG